MTYLPICDTALTLRYIWYSLSVQVTPKHDARGFAVFSPEDYAAMAEDALRPEVAGAREDYETHLMNCKQCQACINQQVPA